MVLLLWTQNVLAKYIVKQYTFGKDLSKDANVCIFFDTDFIIQHASKLVNWTSFLTWKKFRQVIHFWSYSKMYSSRKWFGYWKKSYTWLHIMEFPEKWAKHPETFLEDYHDVINEGLKVHLSLILITGVKTNKPAY